LPQQGQQFALAKAAMNCYSEESFEPVIVIGGRPEEEASLLGK
jgi:hypothetical protein